MIKLEVGDKVTVECEVIEIADGLVTFRTIEPEGATPAVFYVAQKQIRLNPRRNQHA